jgi:ribonuclease BN (tRNA processing enzyme)
MELVPLGVGDAFTEKYYSFCLAVREGATWLLVDCPHPIRKMMREASQTAGVSVTADKIEAVVLTHLHADHSSGLEGLAYFSYFLLRRKLKVIAHPRVLARLWEGHLAAGMEQLLPAVGADFVSKKLEDYLEPIPLDEGAPLELGPFTIDARLTIHHIPTTAVRLRAGGRALGVSADTAFDPSLIAWLGEADLVVHETNHGVHTPYAKLAELPAETRAKMRLVHYPDEFDVDASVIEALRQGARYVI